MISEQRVKELYRLAVYDEYEEKKCRPSGEYYGWDYVGKELVKSFFSGTILFVLLVVLWALRDLSSFFAWLGQADWRAFLVKLAVLYLALLAVYLLITTLVYMMRYAKGRRKLRRYAAHLKKARRLLREEER